MNLVNWAEVGTWFVRHGITVAQLERQLQATGLLGPAALLELEPVTRADAEAAAELEPLARSAGLSLADRFCLATGIRLGLPIFTADRPWLALAIPGAAIHIIR